MHAKLHTTTRRNSLRFVRVIYSSRFNTRPYIVERYNSQPNRCVFCLETSRSGGSVEESSLSYFSNETRYRTGSLFFFLSLFASLAFRSYSIRYTNDSSSIDHLSYYLSLSLSLFFFFFLFLSREDSFLGLEARCNPE